MLKEYWVYIMGSRSGTLYIGVTNNLERRVYEHKHKLLKGFSSQYGCNKLVFAEHITGYNKPLIEKNS